MSLRGEMGSGKIHSLGGDLRVHPVQRPAGERGTSVGQATRRQILGNSRPKGPDPGKHIAHVELRRREGELNGSGLGRGKGFGVVPSHAPGQARVGVGCFENSFGQVHVGRSRLPIETGNEIHGRIIRTEGEVPAMNLAQLGAGLNGPAIGLVHSARDEGQGQLAADAVVIAAGQAEDIGQRGVGPGDVEGRGAKPRGGSADMAGDLDGARVLDGYGRAPRSDGEVDAPAPRAFGFHGAGDADQSEGEFFIAAFEVDASAVDFDPAEARGVRSSRSGARERAGERNLGGPRKPLGKVPCTAGVADEVEAGARERQSAEFDAAAEESLPAEADGHGVGVEKVFVAEAGILSDGDRPGPEHGTAPETEVVAADFDGASEGGLQTSGKFSGQAAVLNPEGDALGGHPQQEQKQEQAHGPAGPGAERRSSGEPRLVARDVLGRGGGHVGLERNSAASG
jgi:hypothetical protein